MLKNRLRLRRYTKITALVLLMSFLKFPMYAEQPTEHQTNLSESVMRFYSDLEVELLIDDLTVAVLEAIEQAAGEAARAAFIASLEREAAALREVANQQAEALRWRNEAEIIRRAGIKNTVLAAVIGILGGLAVGVAGTLIIGR